MTVVNINSNVGAKLNIAAANLVRVHAEPDAGVVLTKAFVRSADRLGLSHTESARILGLSRPSVSRMATGAYVLERERGKEWELASLSVRLYRSLLAIVGTDELAQSWLRGDNTELGASPISLVLNVQGLIQVVQYLDAYRGRL